ncbi:uracil-DNA glycosylase family protein [Aureimonas jatrophae]|uniref:Uracil-DNA glycosylase n=1 Tax=Aureimonas jatrophae TaxID=1166073 RepID=A0A1H0GDS7_9HYPH|nr:uracil-DNA glycosylase family protein [Aureimonas jatrophae]MBB3949524.1 uracil-DNA glycosylase [Aureimonas jatrophae]SDO05026.1 Uracil-DNA glycosylase [Aureimonas jatrophae]
MGEALEPEPNPILVLSATARICIAGQAPGVRADRSGVPFSDPSGDRLRDWMGIGPEVFYDASRIAIVPMGFCFPGLDRHGGDRPPRRECRLTWHDQVFQSLDSLELVLMVGGYAQTWHARRAGVGLPSGGVGPAVSAWRNAAFRDATPQLLPLPHPSWRNNAWLKRNPWFERELLPDLRTRVAQLT